MTGPFCDAVIKKGLYHPCENVRASIYFIIQTQHVAEEKEKTSPTTTDTKLGVLRLCSAETIIQSAELTLRTSLNNQAAVVNALVLLVQMLREGALDPTEPSPELLYGISKYANPK